MKKLTVSFSNLFLMPTAFFCFYRAKVPFLSLIAKLTAYLF